MSAPPTNKLAAPQRRLLRGYGPLVVRLVAFTLMVALVPTVAREQQVTRIFVGSDEDAAPAPPGGATAPPGASGALPTTPSPGASGAQQAAERTASTMSGRAGGAPSHSPPATEANGGANALSPPPGVATACAERPLQVPGDPYSPSCVAFTGDNGGATSRGVTGDEIKVAIRIPADPVADFSSAVAQLTGGDVTETPEDVRRTSEALLEYFNRTFQLYGRRIKAVEYQGRGALTREILGGGQEQANADAIKVESEIGAFADLSAFSQPYADALARRKVMAFGAPYMSREWFSQRRPYAWSLAPDCSRLVEAGAEYANKRLFGKPAAHAGDGLRGKPRKIAVIAPDNPIYQECLDAGLALMEAAGNEVAANISYTLDFASLSNQAASIVSRLKSQGITSVACGCDPVLPVYLTAKANEQGYNPEWLVVGTALTDTDLVAQLYNQEQWAHAFGGSALGDQLPRRAGFGYHAYKAIRDDEPSLVVELLYYHLYMFALGVHQAGPNLTPETFEAGMFSYTDPAVGRIGPAGMWGFGPGVYTAQQAAREIWWDPQRISAYNGKKGAYVVSSGWWRAGQIPAGDPGVFARASAR